MSAAPKHRDAIVEAAATLFRRQGYASTGLNDIVALSGAPKGSLYHYFPAGKTAIAEAAVRLSSAKASRTLEDLAAKSRNAGNLVRDYATLLAGWIEKSGFIDGNAITTTLLEMAPHDAGVTAAGREAFDSWRRILASKLMADGIKPVRAQALAAMAMAAIDGSLIQARVERNAEVIHQVAKEVAAAFRTAEQS
jgi:TetR/AcrR family transcriptional repressor of lmrAB and yxaGH operons